MKKFYLKNLDCANCANKIEREIQKLDGVESATVSFATERLFLEADESKLDKILSEITIICKRVDSDCELVIKK